MKISLLGFIPAIIDHYHEKGMFRGKWKFERFVKQIKDDIWIVIVCGGILWGTLGILGTVIEFLIKWEPFQ